MGGSNELGILGYYDCAVELAEQTAQMGLTDVRVITTVGSMGTYMGLQVGTKNEKLPLHITGIGIEPFEGGIVNKAEKYFEKVKEFYGLSLDIPARDFDLIEDYHFGAYNNPVKEVREAMYYMGRKEAIILDPCYTGKNFHRHRGYGQNRKNQTGRKRHHDSYRRNSWYLYQASPDRDGKKN